MVFDAYFKDSIKTQERIWRGDQDVEFLINSPDQVPPNQSGEVLMKNSSFKIQLCKFLVSEWQKSTHAVYLQRRIFYAAHESTCVRITSTNLSTEVTFPENFQASHPEADTLTAFQTAQCSGSILVRATDTGELIILLGMISRHKAEEIPVQYEEMVMDHGSGNSQRFRNIIDIHRKLEKSQVFVGH